MKLIKITDEHYVIVDDSEIKDNDWVADFRLDGRILISKWNEEDSEDGLFFDAKKITHSTQPMPHGVVREGQITGVTAISLQEVKELLGEVDVEKLGYDRAVKRKWHPDSMETRRVANEIIEAVKFGYNQALEDNKEKKYTEEDMLNAFREGTNAGALHERLCDYDNGDYEDAEQYSEQYEESFIQSLQPETSWKVEIVDNKIRLK